MRDVFYTILVVWLIYRIYNAFVGSRVMVRREQYQPQDNEGKVKVEYSDKSSAKGKKEQEGEYVDYEEIK